MRMKEMMKGRENECEERGKQIKKGLECLRGREKKRKRGENEKEK